MASFLLVDVVWVNRSSVPYWGWMIMWGARCCTYSPRVCSCTCSFAHVAGSHLIAACLSGQLVGHQHPAGFYKVGWPDDLVEKTVVRTSVKRILETARLYWTVRLESTYAKFLVSINIIGWSFACLRIFKRIFTKAHFSYNTGKLEGSHVSILGVGDYWYGSLPFVLWLLIIA